MNGSVFLTTFFALGVGVAVQFAQHFSGSDYLSAFLSTNLINILVAVLAINSATMGIVLTKIRDLVDKHGGEDKFQATKKEMLLSIKAADSTYLVGKDMVLLLIHSCVVGVFVYAMRILYDTAKSVLIIIDYKS
jgi:phosphotransferase system  glucose/maltose/N-acetylglucosamine-specific IIC component